ncbi:MAG: hypothetical protein KKA07_07740 [Bacteroidetes bacterium]|nr:hypothetical protein [Bacteroidota bacterium]MBU1718954.1 hypothetical protein [Bacteroidota bacterium]
MKKNTFKIFGAILLGSMLLWGCGLGKMIKKYPEVKYEVTPEILETHGGSISVVVKGTIPAKYFHKKATVDFTPVLKYNGGEYTLKSLSLQGEKAEGNGTVISYKGGGTISYVDSIPYKPEMNKSELIVNAKATLKSKDVFLGERKLADGVIHTSTRVGEEDETHFGKDAYVKDITETFSANIYFPYNQAQLNWSIPFNKAEESKKKLEQFMAFITNGWRQKSITVSAWASPEGEESLNMDLSTKRGDVADKYLKEELKKVLKKQKIEFKEENFPFGKPIANGEDWNGFMKSLNASDIKDKSAIENVIKNQNNISERQQAIRDMTVVFKEVEDNILPPLRRAELTVVAFKPAKTDEQIAKFSTTKPDSLTLEELLYAATLTEDVNTKLTVYRNAAKVYPKDWRGYNNAAYCLLAQGNNDEAAKLLEQANTLAPNTGIILNNLGVIAKRKKDYESAKSYFESAQQYGINTSFNMAALYIIEGDYNKALGLYGGKTCVYNKGLVQYLLKDVENAQKTLECAPKTAETHYLLAVVAAKKGDINMLAENLSKACELDAKYKKEAKEDLEFKKYFDNTQFQGAVN